MEGKPRGFPSISIISLKFTNRRLLVNLRSIKQVSKVSLFTYNLLFRQNLNSDFTDSALGSTDKSPLPYGNFQLRDTTVQSILSHPRYGPK